MNIINRNINIQLCSSFLSLSPANKPHRYTFIFLHGLEMHVPRLSSVFLSDPIMNLLDDFKIYMPQAPPRHIAMFGGRVGTSWFTPDIPTFDIANKQIKEILANELKEVDNDPKRIFLGGFSQGSCLAFNVATTIDQKIGGVIMVAGFKSKFSKIEENQEIPDTLVIHGDKDERMPWAKAQKLGKTFLNKPNVEKLIVKDMGHNLYSDEPKEAMYNFLRKRAPTQ